MQNALYCARKRNPFNPQIALYVPESTLRRNMQNALNRARKHIQPMRKQNAFDYARKRESGDTPQIAPSCARKRVHQIWPRVYE